MTRALLGLLLAFAALLVAFVTARPAPVTPTRDQQELHLPLGRTRTARMDVRLEMGDLRVDTRAPRGALLTGRASLPHPARLERREQLDGTRANVGYVMGTGVQFGVSDVLNWARASRERRTGLDLYLNPRVPVSLKVSIDVGNATLHLRDARVQDLTVHSDVGDVTLTLPARGRYDAHVRSDVGSTTVRLPAKLAARIHVNHDVGQVRVPEVFSHVGGVYTSPDFTSARDRVELRINADVGDVTVEVLRE